MRVPYLLIGSVLEGAGLLGLVLATPIFGVLATTPVLSVVHILSGTAATVAALRSIKAMRVVGRVLGFLYLALAIVGATVDVPWMQMLLPSLAATGWFHAAVAAVMLYYALLAPPNL